MDQTLAGRRFHTVRPIMHHAGLVPRASGGTVRYAMENVGRRLVRVDLDSGAKLVLFAEDISIERTAAPVSPPPLGITSAAPASTIPSP
jgi:hypothetical protein